MDHAAQSQIEARDAFGELVTALEEGARGAGRGSGNDGRGNGGGNDGGDGGAGDGIGPVDGRMLIDSLRQVAELQTKCSLTLADAMIKALERERVARQDESLQLSETLTTTLRQTADWAERVAVLTDRVSALEHQLAAQRPASAAADDEEEPS
jgi:hypothetical protein